MNTNNNKILLIFSDWGSSKIRTTMIAVLVGVTFYFAAILGRTLSTPPDYIATFWLPNTVILAALLLSDRRRWWIFILAMIPAFILAVFHTGRPVQIAAIYFTANCTEILVAAFALTFIFGTRLKLDRLREMVMFLLLAVLTAPVFSAFIASTTTFVEPEVDYWLTWRIWFLGDALGHLAFTPVIILWVTSGLGWVKGVSFARLSEALGLVLSILVVGYFLLGTEIGASGNLPALLYTPLPVLLWAAIRFGPRGICSAIFVITLLAIWNATNGRGPFTANTPADNVLSLQLFLFAISIPTMLLGSLLYERRQAGEELQRSEERFRTLYDDNPLMLFSIDEYGTVLSVNQFGIDQLGYPEGQLIGQPIINVFHEEDRPLAQNYLRRCFAEPDKVHNWELRKNHQDGKVMYIRETVRVLEDIDGKPTALIVCEDITERKQVEEALSESENKYRTLFEQSADAILILEGDKFVDCNTATIKMLAYKSKEELLETHPSQLSPEMQADGRSSFEKANELMSIALAQGSHRFEWDHQRQNGEVFPVEVLLTAIPFGERNVLHVVWRDITERKQAEEALRTSEERFRDLVNLLPQTIYEADMEGNITFVNNVGINNFGKIVKDIYGKTNIRDFVIPNDRERGSDNRQKILRGEKTTPNEYTMLRNDESTFPAIIYSSPRTQGGNVIGIRGLVVDITEHKQAEEALRETNERFRAAFTDAAIGMVLVSVDNKIIEANPAFCEMLGYTKEEFVGVFFKDITHPDDVDKSLDHHHKLITGEFDNYHFEKRYIHKQGHEVWGLLSVSLVRGKDGTPLYSVAQIQDITERKQAEQTVLESNVELHNLTAKLHAIREEERTTISREIHDELGQALTGLRMDMSWLLNELPGSRKLHKRVQQSQILVDKTIDTIRRISHGLRPAMLDDLGLVPTIEDHMCEFKAHSDCDYDLILDVDDLGLEKERDTVMFRILQETLTNIMRHAHANYVKVVLQQQNDKLILTVEDNGIGIDEEKISSNKSIGLIGMRERALSVGGEIYFSRGEHVGTCVNLIVPMNFDRA